MSYQFYLQYINQWLTPGIYNPPIPCSVPIHDTMMFLRAHQSVQPGHISGNEIITIESESDEDEEDGKTLFCANLNSKVSEELLYEVFLQAGPIEKVYIPKDNTGNSRSYAFVTFKYRSSLPYALRLFQGLVLFGVRLDIKLSKKHK